MAADKKILFRCETFYQLINALNIKMSLLEGKPADLVLSASSDFSEIYPKLESLGIFTNIYRAKDNWLTSLEIKKKASYGISDITKHPEKYLLDDEYISGSYDEMYMPTITSLYDFLLYYAFSKRRGKPLSVYIYEDGMATYYRCGRAVVNEYQRGVIDSSKYRESMRIENNIRGALLYEPELCPLSDSYELIPIPKADEKLRGILRGLFGDDSLPIEKYIFFSEPFVDEFINNNELQLLDFIASKVGKENLIIKNHPRNTREQFRSNGYKIVENKNIPWEVYAADAAIQKKVLISISSTSVFSPKLMYGYDVNSVRLKKMSTKNRAFATKKQFGQLITLADRHYNAEARNLFLPENFGQLELAIDYYERKLESVNG